MLFGGSKARLIRGLCYPEQTIRGHEHREGRTRRLSRPYERSNGGHQRRAQWVVAQSARFGARKMVTAIARWIGEQIG